MSTFPSSLTDRLEAIIDNIILISNRKLFESFDKPYTNRILFENYSSLRIVAFESEKHYPEVTRIITISLDAIKHYIINRDNNSREENIGIMLALTRIAHSALIASMRTRVNSAFN